MIDDSEPSASCDWRLSRAAREIVRLHLVKAWKVAHAETAEAKYNLDVSEWNVWQLLDQMMLATEDNEKCILLPKRDLWKRHEEFSLEEGSDISMSNRHNAIPGWFHAGRRNEFKKNSVFHQCGHCYKNFTSRYYLDRHFDLKHPLDERSFHSCPAVSWCSFLTGTACHDMALTLEPYYGPGSAGEGSDRYTVHRKLIQRQPACIDSNAQAAAVACRLVVQECFGETSTLIAKHLSETMCAAHSCHSRLLHKLIGSTGVMLHPDQWRVAWVEYASEEQHHLGWVGILVMLAVMGYYGQWWLTTALLPARKQKAGKRLLFKKKTPILWTISSPTTFIDKKKAKQH